MRLTPSLRALSGPLARVWPAALVAVLATAPFMRGLRPGRIFFLRDLTTQYWPFHLWARNVAAAGQSALWDPHLAFGQAAIGEAPRFLMFPPALLLRLFDPPELWFNVLVALPFPLAAVGALLLFGRRFGRVGSGTGALIFACSGPVLSTSNFPNFSWAVAFLPWTLWAVDRLVERTTAARFSTCAVFFALLAISGEPVTLAFGAALAVAFAVCVSAPWPGRGAVLRSTASVALAGLAGALLAAIQLLPLLDSSSRSIRGVLNKDQSVYFSLHPLSLLETVMPWCFGSYLQLASSESTWLWATTGAKWPFYVSLYVGLAALLLAALGAVSRRSRWTWFWVAAGAILTVFALGRHTPIYMALRDAVPVLNSFRFPAKYFVFPMLSAGALAASGADALFRPERDPRIDRAVRAVAVVALASCMLAGAAGLFSALAPDRAARQMVALAQLSGLADDRPEIVDPARVPPVPGAAARLAMLAGASALLLLGLRTGSGLARVALLAASVLDPLATNIAVCPSTDPHIIGEPDWVAVTAAHRGDRVYVGARPMQSLSRLGPDPDYVEQRQVPVDATHSQLELEAGLDAEFAWLPSPWGVREAVSHDPLLIWPKEYIHFLIRFRTASVDERRRFLSRTGVRYSVLARPPYDGAVPLAALSPETGGYAVYETEPSLPRALVVPRARVVADAKEQFAALFDGAFDPRAEVLVDDVAAAPAGQPGAPDERPAAIVSETPTELTVSAGAPEGGGYLLLFDSYHPSWRVTVDGRPATLQRADGLFRAVRLEPGPHEVRFSFVPLPYYVGAGVTSATALALLIACAVEARRRLRGGRGFDPQATPRVH